MATAQTLRAAMRAQTPKRYWRIFLFGLGAYFLGTNILTTDGNAHMIPLVTLLASAIVPVTFVLFCWELDAFPRLPLGYVALAFLAGAGSLLIAGPLEDNVLPLVSGQGQGSLAQPIAIGLCEETAKALAIFWALRSARFRGPLQGLIFGAAAGMGFATIETAGYGFDSFLHAFAHALQQPGQQSDLTLITSGVSAMVDELNLRMGLAIFGHGVWTAILCAAIWRERGEHAFRLTGGVLVAYGMAVGLHAAWDATAFAASDPTTQLAQLVAVGLGGLLILRFFIRDASARARLAQHGITEEPTPLVPALLHYLAHPLTSPEKAGMTDEPHPQPTQIVPVGV